MRKLVKMAAVVGFLVGSALPALADMHVPSLTCGDFSALDDAGKLNASTDLLIWLEDVNNGSAAGNLVARYAGKTGDERWTPEKMKIEIEGHCIDTSGSTNLVQRMQEHT